MMVGYSKDNSRKLPVYKPASCLSTNGCVHTSSSPSSRHSNRLVPQGVDTLREERGAADVCFGKEGRTVGEQVSNVYTRTQPFFSQSRKLLSDLRYVIGCKGEKTNLGFQETNVVA